jgi:hypothetical protein
MRLAAAALAVAAAVAALAIASVGRRDRGPPATVLRLASADPRGLAHEPAVADFARRVGRLSGGRLRIVIDRRWSGAGVDDADAPGLLRAVAAGRADLGVAPARSFPAIGVRSFDAFDVPGLVDGYRTEAAVLRSSLAGRMLAGTRTADLAGLALLPGPVSRPVGTRAPLRRAGDLRGLTFGVRASPLADRAVRALAARPLALAYDTLFDLYLVPGRRPAPPSAYEDDLDGIFFDRLEDARPWVTADVGLWARPLVLVAAPRRLGALSARERGWLERAADEAAAAPVRGDGSALPRELCAAGVRLVRGSPGMAADLRRAWRPLRARAARNPALGPVVRDIAALRRRAGADPPPRIPADCARRPGPARGVPSPLPEGVYRTRVTAADLRALRPTESGAEPGTETLTLRDGRWTLVVTEPGRYVEHGTYAGTPQRTTLVSLRELGGGLAYVSVTVDHGGLRFAVGYAPVAFWPIVFASHRWRRIGD